MFRQGAKCAGSAQEVRRDGRASSPGGPTTRVRWKRASATKKSRCAAIRNTRVSNSRGRGWREGVCVPRCRAPAAARGGWRQLPGTPWDGIERAKRPFRGQRGDALLKRWYREDISEARVSCETRRRSEPGAESGTATCGDGALNPGSNRDMYL